MSGLKQKTIVHNVILDDNIVDFLKQLDAAVEAGWRKIGSMAVRTSVNGEPAYYILVEKEVGVH